MTLEGIAKYYSPKSTMFGATAKSTDGDALSITDIMAAQGLTNARARVGIELYLAKVGIMPSEPIQEYLYNLAKEFSVSHKPLQKLPPMQRWAILRIIAEYAFKDYAKSAAATKECEECNGTGFVEKKKFVMNRLAVKHDTVASFVRGDLPASITPVESREMYAKHVYYDIDQCKCSSCNGKGKVKISCRCGGSGKVRDLVESERQGVPVEKTCIKCSGRGFPRLKDSEIYSAIGIPDATWRRNFKPLFELLVQRCYIEESYAEDALKKVTK
ncbi:MAG TPA: antitermination protein [Hafnia paralvei]|uniref:antitermination protein Q n=1 Tax=Hafnia paralvei TaxID=546367 RepID=UPI000ED45BC9|nr:antitermination protein [Hafnia paralvei]HCU16938.1 antitermination protein [Hafnia paralvei]